MAPSIKIQIDRGQPLPNIKQYSLNLETLAGIKPITEEYKTQDLIVPYTSLCNTPILLTKKPHRGEWRFVQDLRAINNIVINHHPVALYPHTLLMAIPTQSKLFTITDLCSTFFSISVDCESQILFAFMWEGQYTWTVMPQV